MASSCSYCEDDAVAYVETADGALLARYCDRHGGKAYDEFGDDDDAEFRPIPAPSKETHG